MESEYVTSLVGDLFALRNIPQHPYDLVMVFQDLGITVADVRANKELILEAGMVLNILRVCDELNLSISPHQSLTLAKHMRVGRHYRKGIPLTDHERTIALRFARIFIEAACHKSGVPFTERHEKDCERMVKFGERGLTIFHKIGEKSGCFHVFMLLIFSFGSLLTFCLYLL